MLMEVLAPYANWALLVLRLSLAIILIRHGWPKLFGLNPGLKGFASWLGSLGFPLSMFWAIIVALLEVFGGAALALGFLTQWVALFVVIEFAVIILAVKIKQPFSEKEFDLIIFAAALALVILGGGSISLDSLLF